MLYVKTEVHFSTIQGLGLFAAEPIEAGQVIARFDMMFGWRCTEEEHEALPEIVQGFLWRYGWRTNGIWFLDMDDSRFMNHSSSPNMRVTTESGFTAYAARNIETGEELTEDYRAFDPDFDKYGLTWGEKATQFRVNAPLRPEVLWFAQAMEQKLRDNDHKGKRAWRDDTPEELMSRLKEELKELEQIGHGTMLGICKICSLTKQLEHAEMLALKLPDLRSELSYLVVAEEEGFMGGAEDDSCFCKEGPGHPDPTCPRHGTRPAPERLVPRRVMKPADEHPVSRQAGGLDADADHVFTAPPERPNINDSVVQLETTRRWDVSIANKYATLVIGNNRMNETELRLIDTDEENGGSYTIKVTIEQLQVLLDRAKAEYAHANHVLKKT